MTAYQAQFTTTRRGRRRTRQYAVTPGAQAGSAGAAEVWLAYAERLIARQRRGTPYTHQIVQKRSEG